MVNLPSRVQRLIAFGMTKTASGGNKEMAGGCIDAGRRPLFQQGLGRKPIGVISFTNVASVSRDERFAFFGFRRCSNACGNSLGYHVQLMFFMCLSWSRILQFLGIYAPPLTHAALHISPLFACPFHAPAHCFHALLLGMAQI